MLSADQISYLRDRSEQLLDPIIDYLIKDICERVTAAGQFTSTAAYQTWIAQNLGISQRQLKKQIAKRLRISQAEAEKLLTQSAEVGYNFDMSRFPTSHAIPLSANSSLQQILSATVALAKEDLTNITQTLGFVGSDGVCRELTAAYNQACDFAFQKVSTGAQDYISAIRDATRNLAEKGIRVIDYESGVHTSVEAAVRRNILGGAGLMQEKISQSNHDLLGCDGWEISAHRGSAPDHEPYQGKQYTDEEYISLNNSFVRRIGTLNCGHSASPIIFGVNEPQYTPEELEQFRRENEEGVTFDGKHYTLYEARQRQRKFERTIRKQQRRILVDESLGDQDKLQTDQIRWVRLRQEYARFSKGTGQRMQYDRMETAGFNWKHAKAAENTVAKLEKAKELRDPARFKESVTIFPPFKGDAITHRSLYNNLAKSDVGKETIEFITSGKCFVDVTYTDDAPPNEYGNTIGSYITVYAKNTKTIKMTAKTLIHEVTHCKYGIGGSQWAEAVCFAREHLHEHGQLTFQDKRNIIKTVKELYPEHQWRKGGRNKWKK